MSCVTSGKKAQVCSEVQRKQYGTKQVHSKMVEKSPLREKCVMYQKKLVFLQF